MMKKIISACGDVCNHCPRFLPKTDEELRRTAELWYQIGYRDKIVSNSEISCTGCTTNNNCTYKIIQCVTDRGIENCGLCEKYPCEKINKVFIKTMSFEPNCKKYCSADRKSVV